MTLTIEGLRDHIVNTGIVLGEYAKGFRANWFADIRESLMSGGWATFVGEQMWERCKHLEPEVFFGKGYGSSHILAAIQAAAYKDGVIVSTLTVRDERKNRNRRRLVEGPRPRKDARAVFIDDVINTGRAYYKSIESLTQDNISVNVVGVACVYDFWIPSGSRRLEAIGPPVFRLLTRHDLGFTRKDDHVPEAVSELCWRSLHTNQWNSYYKTRPLIDGDRVYYGTDKHRVYCHDLSTGDLLWEHHLRHTTRLKGLGCGFGIDSKYLYVTSYDGTIRKLDKLTGYVIWVTRLDVFIHSAPELDGDIVYVGTEGGIGISGAIQAVCAITGNPIWRVPNTDATPCTPKVFDELVICGSNDDKLYAIEKLSGAVHWTVTVGDVKGQVAIVKNVIVCSSDDGNIYGISKEGEILWSRTAGLNTCHQHVQTDGEYAFITNGFCVVAYDSDGNQKWFRQMRVSALWNLTFDGKDLIVVTINGRLRVLCTKTGRLKQASNLTIGVRTPCAVTSDHIAVASTLRGLYLFKRNPCSE